MLKDKIKLNLVQFKNLILEIPPKGRNELLLFFGFCLFYLSYGIPILYNTCIIDNPYMRIDMYLSFDNNAIFHNGVQNIISHPLLLFVYKPLVIVGDMLATLLGYKSKGVFFLCFCSTMVSLSIIYVYRYLQQILGLKKYILFLLTLFYGFTGTCLILSFTTESFTISLFLLSLCILYYSSAIKNNRDVGIFTNAFFALMLGGVTVTNFVKGLIPMLYTKGKMKYKLKKILVVGVLFFVCLVFVELRYDVLSDLSTRVSQFSSHSNDVIEEPITKQIFTNFWGSPIFLPDYTLKGEHSFLKQFILGYYTHWIEYAVVISLLLLVIASAILNFRQKLLQILLLFLGVDILIHTILLYGLDEAFIYGGHWIFLVPLFLGWLYKALNKKYALILTAFLTILFVVTAANNVLWMIDFYEYMTTYLSPIIVE